MHAVDQQRIFDEQRVPVSALRDLHEPAHFVQFYEADAFLERTVGELVLEAFQSRRPAVVIATPAHRSGIEKILHLEGFDLDKLDAAGLYYFLDAAATLEQFMSGGHPDAVRFHHVVGSVIAEAARKDAPVLAFGEMVALLWAQGKADAAIELEELWNDLGRHHRFSLCCAYPIKAFNRQADGEPFRRICGTHSHVIPAESFPRNDSTADERLRTIAALQQKAATLEAEIARRKEVEETLAREKRELSDFLENAVEAIHKVDANGTIMWANRAELELLGYGEADYVGRHIAEFHADRDTIADILRRLASGERLRDYEARLKHKDGSLRYVSISSSTYRKNDRFVYSTCFTRDITERKLAAELLEKAVAERTAELKEVVSELESSSYSVSHDLRAPLRGIHGYARSLLEDYGAALESEAVARLKRIDLAAHRLDALVQDILAYGKISHGELTMAPISLDRLVADILHQHPGIEGRRNSITLEQLYSVMGHEAYVGQCLTNLIDNAVKFVAPGITPLIKVGSEEIGDWVRVYVSDNGIGIDPAHHDRIFQMFSRVHPQKVYDGTGIGLAIVKKAVSRMGGTVGFESEPGRGSTFWFTLPKAEPPEY